jgi:hypothetical protein
MPQHLAGEHCSHVVVVFASDVVNVKRDTCSKGKGL